MTNSITVNNIDVTPDTVVVGETFLISANVTGLDYFIEANNKVLKDASGGYFLPASE